MSFVTNRWVRSDDFVGRADILSTIRNRIHRPTWILGNRRVGKTSLLRQIEWLCDQRAWGPVSALYWDVQGAGSSDGLKESLLESLEDKPALIEQLQIDIDELEQAGFAELVLRLRRRIRQSGVKRLLILIDEVEELVDITGYEPQVLSTLRKLQDNAQLVTIILSGSLRLLDLDESESRTSPFLPDFLPPVLLGPFHEAETMELLARESIDTETAKSVQDVTFGNPHLVQCVGDRLQRHADLHQATDELHHSNILSYFFRSNFNCLKEPYRAWYGDGNLLQRLETIGPRSADIRYFEQSSILRIGTRDTIHVNPLLVKIETPSTVTSTIKIPDTADLDAAPAHDVFALIETLRTRESPLSVLPLDILDGGLERIRDYVAPANLNILYSTGEDQDALHQVLDFASPEYIKGLDPDGRTSVFLVGVFLFHLTFGEALFSALDDPWERAEALSETDTDIQPFTASGERINSKLAMVLLRCLRADPRHRYADLDQLSADLLSTFGASI